MKTLSDLLAQAAKEGRQHMSLSTEADLCIVKTSLAEMRNTKGYMEGVAKRRLVHPEAATAARKVAEAADALQDLVIALGGLD